MNIPLLQADGLPETYVLRGAPPAWVIWLLIVPAIVAFSWFTYRMSGDAPPLVRRVLTGLRVLALAFIAVLLMNPSRETQIVERQKTLAIVMVDVSASMHFGAQRSKLQVAADFVEALGPSAFRVGDAVGLLAFDHEEREDLFMPPRHSRGAGIAMAEALRRCRSENAWQHDTARHNGAAALQRGATRRAGRPGRVCASR